MPEEVKPAAPAAEEFTCGFGKCVKEHPLHCCHTAYGVSYRTNNPKVIARGWKCDCGKQSRVTVAMRVQ